MCVRVYARVCACMCVHVCAYMCVRACVCKFGSLRDNILYYLSQGKSG